MKDKIEPVLDDAEKLKAVETALTMPQAKSFAPPSEQGILELVHGLQDVVNTVVDRLLVIEKRLVEFDRLQARFYNGRKP